MNKTTLIIIALIIIIGGYFLLRGNDQVSEDGSLPSAKVPDAGFENTPETIVIPNQAGGSLSPDESELALREISMVTDNLYFSPNNLTLAKGQPVKINILNSGNHTFTIDVLEVDVLL